MKIFLFLCIVFPLSIFAQPVWSQPLQELVTLEIKITGEGKPLEDAKVLLEIKSQNYSRQDITRGNGEVRFSKVPIGKAHVLVISKGWKTFGENLKIVEGANIKRFKFDLKKEKMPGSATE